MFRVSILVGDLLFVLISMVMLWCIIFGVSDWLLVMIVISLEIICLVSVIFVGLL